MAYAAGFAGVLYLFHYSLAPLALSLSGAARGPAAVLVLLLSLFASLLALGLAFAAGVSLDRSPGKSGVLPAIFGYAVGLFGTVASLYQPDALWRQLLFGN